MSPYVSQKILSTCAHFSQNTRFQIHFCDVRIFCIIHIFKHKFTLYTFARSTHGFAGYFSYCTHFQALFYSIHIFYDLYFSKQNFYVVCCVNFHVHFSCCTKIRFIGTADITLQASLFKSENIVIFLCLKKTSLTLVESRVVYAFQTVFSPLLPQW